MKNSRAIWIWVILALCGSLVLGTMAWLTRSTMASEKTRVEAEARADLEERTRLALWRMDAIGASMISAENSRAAADDEAANFSTEFDALIKLRFSLEEGGKLQPLKVSDLHKLSNLREVLRKKPIPGAEWSILTCAVSEVNSNTWGANKEELKVSDAKLKENKVLRGANNGADNRVADKYQDNSSIIEKNYRAKAVESSLSQTNNAVLEKAAPAKKIAAEEKLMAKEDASSAPAASPPIQLAADRDEAVQAVPLQEDRESRQQIASFGTMRATWIDQDLFVLRKLSGSDKEQVQGSWFDREAVKKRLLAEVNDLFPKADLLLSEKPTSDPLALVSFPFHLARNEAAPIIQLRPGLPILVGWAAVLLAIMATSALVYGVMNLSERRASFVSAVTHELRTPLTTFRLYSEMLESDVVKPEKRGAYLRVLSREADRLAHLVENVLSFSKVERGSARSVIREAKVIDLLEPMRERLESRLSAAALALDMNLTNPAAERTVRVDAAALEHILFNLVDNAAKYAAESDPPQIEIRVLTEGKFLTVHVRDFGPGIRRAERQKIFRAFHKSAHDAAESRPGVGLGLALSRRLAKSLGGKLDCIDSPKGACFVLTLPLPC